jgi:putative two-component system response regulator
MKDNHIPGIQKKLLIIDDTEVNRVLLREAFCKSFNILEADNGIKGLSLFKKNETQLAAIFLDIIMPELDGFGVLLELEKHDVLRRVPVFLITTEASDSVVDRAYKYGVVDVIPKPFNMEIIQRRVMNIIELYNNRNQLETLFNQQMHVLSDQGFRLQENLWSIIEGLSATVESRSAETGNHIARVKNITGELLRSLSVSHPEYNLTESKIELISRASVLHDIGKISIPDKILNKPASEGRLTPEEFEIMKTHTTNGCKLLDSIKGIKNSSIYSYCYDICRSHHEKWDGKGYPDGLKGNDIPISAQVVSLADVYDALISKRVYKPAFSHKEAVRMINDGECGMFNPDLLEGFNRTIDNIYDKLYRKDFDGQTFKI